MLFASRLTSATTTAGTLFELDAIAAAYIGGVSAAGGVGKVTGSFVGALVYISLTSGMNLMGTDISFQYVVRGAVLALAVIFDVATRRAGAPEVALRHRERPARAGPARCRGDASVVALP